MPAIAAATTSLPLGLAAGLLSMLALYRALSFIHELTHIRDDEAPGFRVGWNVLVGVPLMTPSLMYEGVHNIHHIKDRFGTKLDPEYLPLSRFTPLVLMHFLPHIGQAASSKTLDVAGKQMGWRGLMTGAIWCLPAIALLWWLGSGELVAKVIIACSLSTCLLLRWFRSRHKIAAAGLASVGALFMSFAIKLWTATIA